MEPTVFLVVLASLFLGWSAGANDAASAVGTPIGAGTIGRRTAILIVVVFSVIGFLLQGQYVSKSVGAGLLPNGVFENKSMLLAAIASVAITTIFTIVLSLPISINHALVGGILGVGLMSGMISDLNHSILYGIIACWLTTPLISFMLTVFFHKFVVTPVASRMNWVDFSKAFKFLSVCGAIAVSYNLGASAISTILSPLLSSDIAESLRLDGMLTVQTVLGLLIAVAFGLGVVTFSGRVIRTISSKIALLGPSTAFSAQFCAALTVYFFVLLGLPASITHAIVGGIAGIGVLKNTRTLSSRTLTVIILGWIFTPIVSALLAVGIFNVLLL
jgi:PiT family inorganic phosphate transporter